MSTSGQYQTSVVKNGSIWRSSDYGATWSDADITVDGSAQTSLAWYSVSLSATGQYQSANVTDQTSVGIYNYIYVSSDYGATWISITSTGTQDWRSISISASGKYQTALGYNTSIYVSSDYGSNWSAVTSVGGKIWYSTCISASGQYQFALTNSTLYLSSDYGFNWSIALSNTAGGSLTHVAVCASGQYVFVPVNGVTSSYGSEDFGKNWILNTIPTSIGFQSTSISATGQYIVAGTYGDGVYISSDFGRNWSNANNLTLSFNYVGCAISGSGQYLTVVTLTGSIYTSIREPDYWQVESNTNKNNIYYDKGYVGIGTSAPSYPLEIESKVNNISANFAGGINFDNYTTSPTNSLSILGGFVNIYTNFDTNTNHFVFGSIPNGLYTYTGVVTGNISGNNTAKTRIFISDIDTFAATYYNFEYLTNNDIDYSLSFSCGLTSTTGNLYIKVNCTNSDGTNASANITVYTASSLVRTG